MINRILTILVLFITTFATIAHAENLIYFGLGSAEEVTVTDISTIKEKPFAAGYFRDLKNNFIFGFDVAGEGRYLDSTYGQNHFEQATSYNAIIGPKILETETGRLDIGALVGFRNEKIDCPDSYLGFQCYADEDPTVERTLNYGILATYTYTKALVGVRTTGESLQFLIGTRF